MHHTWEIEFQYTAGQKLRELLHQHGSMAAVNVEIEREHTETKDEEGVQTN